jgi:hypothetical protein
MAACTHVFWRGTDCVELTQANFPQILQKERNMSVPSNDGTGNGRYRVALFSHWLTFTEIFIKHLVLTLNITSAYYHFIPFSVSYKIIFTKSIHLNFRKCYRFSNSFNVLLRMVSVPLNTDAQWSWEQNLEPQTILLTSARPQNQIYSFTYLRSEET